MPTLYLDAAPVITALRERPQEFRARGTISGVTHRPSGHVFHDRDGGGVYIQARCDCQHVEMTYAAQDNLRVALDAWRRDYWLPLEQARINAQFAGHFRRPGVLRRVWRAIWDRQAYPLPAARPERAAAMSTAAAAPAAAA